LSVLSVYTDGYMAKDAFSSPTRKNNIITLEEAGEGRRRKERERGEDTEGSREGHRNILKGQS
jgi:hypothetical protein